jgi:glycosyltransferase involved in cell wall biosynthesis
VKIGIAGPVSLEPLKPWLPKDFALPSVYSFPLIGRLAAGLLTRGHEVTIFAGSEALQETLSFAHGSLSLKITRRRARWAAYDFYANEVRFLADAMRASHCDIIHAHWSYEFAKAALKSETPTLVTAHDSPSLIPSFYRWTRAYFFWLFRSQLGRQVLNYSPNLTCVSPYLKKAILPLLSKDREVQIIPNGVGTTLFAMGEERLGHSSFSSPPCIVACLEGFTSRKNPISALLGFAAFRNLYPKATMVMYGGGFEMGGPAYKWALKHRLVNGVIFKGHTPQPVMHREMCDEATVLLHPALEESFGMAPLEAMALGIPVVGGKDSGAIPYLLDHGKAGVLVNVRYPLDICDALIALHRDSRKAHQLAQTAWEYARSHFTEDLMIDRYLSAYTEILRHSPS